MKPENLAGYSMDIHNIFEGTGIFTSGREFDGRMGTWVPGVGFFGSDGYVLILPEGIVVRVAVTVARAGRIGTLKVCV